MFKKSWLLVLLSIIVLIFPMYSFYSLIAAEQKADVLRESWTKYKATYITPDGAVRRIDQGNDVVSEGVAYAMLRAVMMNDQATFDNVYSWTEWNMSRNLNPSIGDNLLAWKYTDQVVDWGAASDADLDYALALAFASKKWATPSRGSLPAYEKKSLAVQQDILRLETGRANGKLYLQPGTWNEFKAPLHVNPSYISPAHYKIFNLMQSDPRWNELVDSGYDVLWKSSGQIDGDVGVGLPPNWLLVHDDGSVSKSEKFDVNYAYDAFRTSFRVALDYSWFGEERAKNYLTVSGARSFLAREFNSNGKLFAEYSHSGQVLGQYDNPGVYGVNIGWFMPENPEIVSQFISLIEKVYQENNGMFFATPSYYMENWTWFGYALGTNNFPNLYSSPNINESPKLLDLVLGESTSTDKLSDDIYATEYLTGLHILAPQNNSTQRGLVSLQVFNDLPRAYGTWWSVDSGSWVAVEKTDVPNVWKTDIDLSGWQWSDNGSYILHAWTMNSSQEVKHTQITIQK